MSSSSSIAAARRRRAGGAGGPTPQSKPVQQQQTPTPPPSNVPVNPFTILQQHHVKINKLEQIIQELLTKETSNVNTNSSVTKQPPLSSTQSDVNVNELGDLIMARVEEQLDLKAFYENDERLMNEIEGLKGIIQSQQMVINGFNNTLYTIMDKLHISAPVSDDIVGDDSKSENENISLEAFPKKVVIDEASNTIKEFIESSTMEDADNTQHIISGDITCNGLSQI
jgi:hypothetical protein